MKDALLIALGVVLTLLSNFLLDFFRRKRQKNEGRAHLSDLLLRLRGDLLWVAMLYEAPKDVTDPLGCPTTFFEFPRKLSKQSWELANSTRNELPVEALGELEHLDEILQRATSHQDVARSKISRDPSTGKFSQVNVDDGTVVASPASCVSALFLVGYLTHHAIRTYYFGIGPTRFTGEGIARPIYLTILTSHTILATLIGPFVILTLRRGLKGWYESHKKLARGSFIRSGCTFRSPV